MARMIFPALSSHDVAGINHLVLPDGGTGWISPESDTIPITSASTPLKGLLVVGDSNFPGPGVPSAGPFPSTGPSPPWYHPIHLCFVRLVPVSPICSLCLIL